MSLPCTVHRSSRIGYDGSSRGRSADRWRACGKPPYFFMRSFCGLQFLCLRVGPLRMITSILGETFIISLLPLYHQRYHRNISEFENPMINFLSPIARKYRFA